MRYGKPALHFASETGHLEISTKFYLLQDSVALGIRKWVS